MGVKNRIDDDDFDNDDDQEEKEVEDENCKNSGGHGGHGGNADGGNDSVESGYDGDVRDNDYNRGDDSNAGDGSIGYGDDGEDFRRYILFYCLSILILSLFLKRFYLFL